MTSDFLALPIPTIPHYTYTKRLYYHNSMEEMMDGEIGGKKGKDISIPTKLNYRKIKITLKIKNNNRKRK